MTAPRERATTQPDTQPDARPDARSDARADRSEEVDRLARDVFGYDGLRPAQAEAVAALLAGHDVLLVMPTGAGKSAAYQLPALLLDGPTVVVSPLLSLQRDQVDHLNALGPRTRAVAISSATGTEETQQAWDALAAGQARFVFLSPEQLANPDVLHRVRDLRPALVAVDEAHAMSGWGHDFRPDYLRLGRFVDELGRPRVIALTATAAPPVRDDVVSRLGLRDPVVLVSGLARPNIRLDVVRHQEAEAQHTAVLLNAASEAKPMIVYTATRKDSEALADELADLGLAAEAYHGGLRSAERTGVQERFMTGELDVVVATNAFGMGIDKPDVRTVVHAAVPDSPDAYYQEVGRAGRDGEPALAVLHYRPEDLGMRRFFSGGLPKEQHLVRLAGELRRDGTGPHGADRRALAERTGLSVRVVGRLLNLLGEDGDDVPDAPVQAAARAVATAESHQRLRRSRVEMMRGYAETEGCRRGYLLGYFAEGLDEPCGRCDRCEAGTAVAAAEADAVFPLQSRVRHASFGEGVVMSHEQDPDRVTVLFADAGYRTLALAALEGEDLMQRVA